MRLLVLIIATMLLTSGCRRSSSEVADQPVVAEVPELAAETVRVGQVDWPTVVRVQGTMHADEISSVGARVAGRVREVHVDLGDEVEQGQPLVSLDSDQLELMVAQAEAQLAQARTAVGLLDDRQPGDEIGELVDTLDPENTPPVREQRAIWKEAKASLRRADSLLKQDAISQGEYDVLAAAESVAEAKYAAAINTVREQLSLIGIRRVELSLAGQQLQDAVIRAPFDARVQSRQVAPGGFISAGDTVISLVRTDPIWFRGTLPERYASKLQTGLPVNVRVESIDQPLQATVTRISPSLDLSTRSLAFEARIDNPDQRLRSGLFARADLILDPQSQVIAVPEEAISEFAGRVKIWKLVDGIAEQIEIVTGVRRDGWVEIVDGLSQGDTVLSDASVGRVAKVVPATSSASNDVETASGGKLDGKTAGDRAGGSTAVRTKQVDTLAGVAGP